jgi:hypothetical protein
LERWYEVHHTSSPFDHALILMTWTLHIGGIQRFGRFGWSITASDFNGDGRKEIVVGEPRSSGRNTMITNLITGIPPPIDPIFCATIPIGVFDLMYIGEVEWTGAEMAGAVRIYSSPK